MLSFLRDRARLIVNRHLGRERVQACGIHYCARSHVLSLVLAVTDGDITPRIQYTPLELSRPTGARPPHRPPAIEPRERLLAFFPLPLLPY